MSEYDSTGRRRRRLKNLVVNRVDFVDRPANPDARVAIYKREDTGNSNTLLTWNTDTTSTSNANVDIVLEMKAGRKVSQSNLDRILAAIAQLSEILDSATGTSKSATAISSQLRMVPSNKNHEEVHMQALETLKEQVAKMADLSGDDLDTAVEEVGKSLGSLVDEITSALAAAKEEAAASVRAELEAKAEEDDSDADEDVAKRDDLPEDVRKRFEDIEKRAQEAESRVQKMEAEARRAEFVAKAEDFRNIATPEEFGPVLQKVADALTEDEFKAVNQWLTAANAQLDRSELFKEYGRGDSAPSDIESKVASLAKALREADPTLSEEQARVEVLTRNPDLYAQHQAERSK